MNSPEVKAFIREHADLFWYVPNDKKEDISEGVLVEFIINYGTLNDFLRLGQLIGLKKIYDIITNLEGRKQGNYFPELLNFYTLYLQRNA